MVLNLQTTVGREFCFTSTPTHLIAYLKNMVDLVDFLLSEISRLTLLNVKEGMI